MTPEHPQARSPPNCVAMKPSTRRSASLPILCVVLGLAIGLGTFLVPRWLDDATASANSKPRARADHQPSVAAFGHGIRIDPAAGHFATVRTPRVKTPSPAD